MSLKDRFDVFWNEIERSGSKPVIIVILVVLGAMLLAGLGGLVSKPTALLFILVQYPVFLMALVFHECAHGLAALVFGDTTARDMGRLSLNPVKHLDPIGTIVFVLASMSGVGFGWAKPVPVDPSRFRNYFWGEIAVSLAGVAANVLFALWVWSAWLAFAPVEFRAEAAAAVVYALRYREAAPGVPLAQALITAGVFYAIVINFVLLVFNLLPIPPLDGSHVLKQLLPPRLRWEYARIGRYGFLVIFAIIFIFPGLLSALFMPFINLAFKMIIL